MNSFNIGQEVYCRNEKAEIISFARGIKRFKCLTKDGQVLTDVQANEMEPANERMTAAEIAREREFYLNQLMNEREFDGF